MKNPNDDYILLFVFTLIFVVLRIEAIAYMRCCAFVLFILLE